MSETQRWLEPFALQYQDSEDLLGKWFKQNPGKRDHIFLATIDLYYCHRLDQVTPIEKTVEEMKKLKHEGKIKYLGLSECSSESLKRACKVEHIDAIQIEYEHTLTRVMFLTWLTSM
jgi:aryl-alcohol dehydrogenase-like predicted oxidoreductase